MAAAPARPPAAGVITGYGLDEGVQMGPVISPESRGRIVSAIERAISVAAPMAFFPFSGARESFFGDLHAQGRDAIEFFTQEKVVVERWPTGWTRRF